MELLGTAEHDEVELRTLGVSSYFMEIGSFRRRTNDVPFRIDEVVKVRGDKRPGQQPFPHPFPARMPIEVATAAVEGLSMPGDLVLDPMSGSGVVSKAAIALGRRAVAFDIDPLAVVQGRALCSPTAPCAFVETAARVRDRAAEILSHELTLGREWDGFDDEGRRFLEYWFPRAHANELIALSLALDDIVATSEWSVYATLVSSLVISRGSGASLAMGLSRSRPHRVVTKVPWVPAFLRDAWSSRSAPSECLSHLWRWCVPVRSRAGRCRAKLACHRWNAVAE